GAHTREDYPKRDDKNFLKHSIVNLENDELKLSYKDEWCRLYRFGFNADFT
ncbi:hypothetical protein, partial [Campylobacter jejuni]|uniref:hypothetical protein n=1 Tax=Campylobacter jejuni TaxID=197 RepID=UPI00224476CD